MKIKSLLKAGVTQQGNRVCEDAICINDHMLGVFDGATAATKDGPFVAPSGKTDAHWIANMAARLLPFHTQGLDATELMPRMNSLLAQKFNHSVQTRYPNIRGDWLAATQCPATTASIALKRNDIIHFMQVGDSPIMIKPKRDKLIVMEGDPVLVKHDRVINQNLQNLRSLYPTLPLNDLNTKRRDKVPCIRHRMNTVDGYGVLTVKETDIMPMKHVVAKASDIESFVIMSDGLMELYDVFRSHASYEEFYETLTGEDGLEIAHLALTELQKDDPEGQEFPRPKMGDDCAAIHCRL